MSKRKESDLDQAGLVLNLHPMTFSLVLLGPVLSEVAILPGVLLHDSFGVDIKSCMQILNACSKVSAEYSFSH